MKGLFDRFDRKYLKIGAYASLTVIITAVILTALYHTTGIWLTMWAMFTAVLKPIMIGGILSFLFFPAVRKIERMLGEEKKWARSAAVLIFYLIVLVILGVIVTLIAFAVKGGIDSIANLNFEEIRAAVMSLYKQFEDTIKSLENQISSSDLPFNLDNISSVLGAFINGVTGFFSSMLFGIIFSIYFMIDEKNIRTYWSRAAKAIIGSTGYTTAAALADEANEVFSGYIRGQALDATVVGATTAVSFFIAGIPYGPLIGIGVGIGNLIPYVGPLLGYIATIIVCLVTAQYDKMIIGLILLALIMFIDGNVINPKLLSNSIKVHPLLVVGALIGGGALGGLVGMIIAVPTAAFIKIQFDKYISYRESLQESSDAQAEQE